MTIRPKTAARTKARDGQGYVRPVESKTKGTRYEAFGAMTRDPVTGQPYRPTKTFGSEKEAWAWIDSLRQVTTARGMVRDKSHMIPAIVEMWLREDSTGKAPTTMKSYGNLLKNHIRPRLNVSAKGLTEYRYYQFLAATAAACSQANAKGGGATAYMCHVVVTGALNWASGRRRLIQENPLQGTPFQLDGVQQKAKIEHIPTADIERILAAAEGQPTWLLYRIMAATGLRRGEALGLNVGDINPLTGEIRIDKISAPELNGKVNVPRTKSKRDRDVHLPQRDLPLYRQALAGRDPSEPVIKGPDGGRLLHSTYWNWWARDLKAAGLAGQYTPHQLRHSYATYALSSQINPTAVSSILGHRSARVTLEIYAHVIEGQKQDISDAVSSAMDLSVAGFSAGSSKPQPSISTLARRKRKLRAISALEAQP